MVSAIVEVSLPQTECVNELARKTVFYKYLNIRIFGKTVTEYSNIHLSMSQSFEYIRIFVRASFSIFTHPCPH